MIGGTRSARRRVQAACGRCSQLQNVRRLLEQVYTKVLMLLLLRKRSGELGKKGLLCGCQGRFSTDVAARAVPRGRAGQAFQSE